MQKLTKAKQTKKQTKNTKKQTKNSRKHTTKYSRKGGAYMSNAAQADAQAKEDAKLQARKAATAAHRAQEPLRNRQNGQQYNNKQNKSWFTRNNVVILFILIICFDTISNNIYHITLIFVGDSFR